MVDVGVVCSGTARYIAAADIVTGAAATMYERVKLLDKYADQDNFVPFSIETGDGSGFSPSHPEDA